MHWCSFQVQARICWCVPPLSFSFHDSRRQKTDMSTVHMLLVSWPKLLNILLLNDLLASYFTKWKQNIIQNIYLITKTAKQTSKKSLANLSLCSSLWSCQVNHKQLSNSEFINGVLDTTFLGDCNLFKRCKVSSRYVAKQTQSLRSTT